MIKFQGFKKKKKFTEVDCIKKKKLSPNPMISSEVMRGGGDWRAYLPLLIKDLARPSVLKMDLVAVTKMPVSVQYLQSFN